jgi:hypothetical protein
VVTLSQFGRLAVSLMFALTLIFGAYTTIRQRILIYVVIALTVSTFVVGGIAGIHSSQALAALDTALKLACLSTLLSVTLEGTLRPGKVTVYRVVGGRWTTEFRERFTAERATPRGFPGGKAISSISVL